MESFCSAIQFKSGYSFGMQLTPFFNDRAVIRFASWQLTTEYNKIYHYF